MQLFSSEKVIKLGFSAKQCFQMHKYFTNYFFLLTSNKNKKKLADSTTMFIFQLVSAVVGVATKTSQKMKYFIEE